MTVNLPRSAVIRSRVPTILRDVPAEKFAGMAGISIDLARELKRDDRLLPPVPLLEKLYMAYGVTPNAVIAFDPVTDLKALAPGWFRHCDGKARIAICGMGNLGHVFAGVFSARPDVTVAALVSSRRSVRPMRRS